MATAVQSMTATEAAENAHNNAMKAIQEINSRVSFFAAQRVTLESDIERLELEYDRACRQAAKGDPVDLVPIATQIQAKRSRLRGAQLEYEEAVATAEPLAKTAQRAGLSLALRRNEDEFEALLKSEVEAANFAREALQKAEEAKRAHNAVNYEIGQLRKNKQGLELELRAAQ